MTESTLETTNYESRNRQVSWQGISMADGDAFDSFMANDVASRLYDEEGMSDFESHLRNLAITGFANDSLDEILTAEIQEGRDWAVGEALAEAHLMHQHDIAWPWNMERDKRTPNASLPGADLIGFEINGEDVRLALGEVKTSSDENTPPNVMYGRSGMTHQIDNLNSNLGLLCQILKWLHPRCKGTEYETLFATATTLLLDSENKAFAMFGVLIRDTEPNVLDLQTRGNSLAGTLHDTSTCKLIAIYVPCAIAELSVRVLGDRS